MNSQIDLFEDFVPKKTKVKYDFLVLCDKDEAVKYPFASFPRSMFSAKEVQDRWLDSILDDSSRLKSLNTLEGLPNKQFALFGKIEQGISKDLRDSTINSLNIKYDGMRTNGESQTSTLLSLVKIFPYRLISVRSRSKTQFTVFPHFLISFLLFLIGLRTSFSTFCLFFLFFYGLSACLSTFFLIFFVTFLNVVFFPFCRIKHKMNSLLNQITRSASLKNTGNSSKYVVMPRIKHDVRGRRPTTGGGDTVVLWQPIYHKSHSKTLRSGS